MTQCPHCQADLSAHPVASSCVRCGWPLSPPSPATRPPAVGRLTRAGIILTLLWVVLVNFLDHCKGAQQEERLRNNPWVKRAEPLRPPAEGADPQSVP